MVHPAAAVLPVVDDVRRGLGLKVLLVVVERAGDAGSRAERPSSRHGVHPARSLRSERDRRSRWRPPQGPREGSEVFIYAIIYFSTRLAIEKPVSTMLYFGY